MSSVSHQSKLIWERTSLGAKQVTAVVQDAIWQDNSFSIEGCLLHWSCKTNWNSHIIHLLSRKFKTAATTWGNDHESVARNKYRTVMSATHENFLVSICGFFINVQYPFIGASPDGLVTCTCCGEGICEIKVSAEFAWHCWFPLIVTVTVTVRFYVFEFILIQTYCTYTYKDASIASAVQDNSFCLEKQGASDMRLKRNHAYFYQVCV